MHDGVLKGNSEPSIPKDNENFGVIHGDLNVSNYFVRDDGVLSVFDWDQTQRAWYLYDLAQCIWGVTMAVLCGMPMSGTKIDCDL